MQNLSNTSEMLIKHNCKRTAFPLRDFMQQKNVFFMSFQDARVVDALNLGGSISIATAALAVKLSQLLLRFSFLHLIPFDLFSIISSVIFATAAGSTSDSFLLGALDIR